MANPFKIFQTLGESYAKFFNVSIYRYHDLFRTFLQEQLRRRPLEEVRQWHRRAAQASPQPARKINHLLLAEAFDEAAGQIEAIAAQMIEEGWGAQLPEWIARLPPQSVIAHPRLALLMGMSRLAEMQNDEAKRWLTQARAGLAAAGDEAGEADALASLSQCLAVLNENEAAAQVIAETLARPLTIPQRILVLAAQAYVDIDHANVASALGNYAEAIRLAELQPTPAVINTLALNLHSGVMNEPLSTPLAERLARLFAGYPNINRPNTNRLNTNRLNTNRMVEGMAHVWQAWAYLGRGQPRRAIEQMEQALEISRQLGGSFNIACESFGLPVWLAFLGNASQSEEALTQFLEELDRSSLTGFRQTVGDGYAYEIGRAKWNLRRDDELRTLYEQLPKNHSASGRARTPILRDLMQGMLLLSAQQYQEAAILFERASTHRSVTLFFAKHAEALLAYTYYLQGAHDRALARFVPILDFFAAEETPGHIWNMGPRVVKPLLALAIERHVQSDLVRSLLALMPDAGGNSSSSSAAPTGSTANLPSSGIRIPDTGETLSERQIEVLHLIVRGDDNPTIAETLVVSVHTIKSHVAHILAKLGVSSRTAAAVRAKELGLVK